jgi:type III restriction enzyme
VRFELKDFQTDAVSALLAECRSARREVMDNRPQAIVLSSPTGSGKTVIVTDLLEKLWNGYEGNVADKRAIFLWLSDQPELNEQSRMKIDAASEVFLPSRLVPIDTDFDQEKLEPGRIYFLNTQKLREGSHLTKRADRRTWTIWETVDNTIAARPESFYLIIDEAHRGMRHGGRRSAAADTRSENERLTIVQRFIRGYETIDDRGQRISMRATPLIIGMSATPERFNAVLQGARRTQRPVDVPWTKTEDGRAGVQESGLIKDRIILGVADDDQPGDWALLQHAGKKLDEFTKEWETHCLTNATKTLVKPVLIVQVEDGSGERVTKTDLSRAVDVLSRGMGGIAPGSLAHCMDHDGDLTAGEHLIRKIDPSKVQDDPQVRVVFFKTALTTGWDCPRAEVMMSFRRAQDSTLIAQLVGRMVRTPLARRIENNDLLSSVWLALPHYDEEGVKSIVEKLENADTGTPAKVENAKDLVTYLPNADLFECFELLKQLPTYHVERPRRMAGTRRLMKLARRLTWNGIAKTAMNDAKKLIIAALEGQRKRLHRDPAFSEKVTGKAKINVREFVIEYGEWKEELESRTFLIEATPENVDDLFEQCYGVLGEGINELYVKTLFEPSGDMLGKLELFCILQDKAAFDAVQLACDREVERLLREYADDITALSADEQAKIDDVRRRGAEPAVETLKPPENLIARKQSPKWERHLYVDDKGKFGWAANTWESPVLKAALANKNVVGWFRNEPRKPGSLCIPYGRAEKKPLYPDLLIFRRERGKLQVDILDPHGDQFSDNAEKAAGLATFARRHGDMFGHIEFIRVVKGRIARLRIHDATLREKVERVADDKHLNDLFDASGWGDVDS